MQDYRKSNNEDVTIVYEHEKKETAMELSYRLPNGNSTYSVAQWQWNTNSSFTPNQVPRNTPPPPTKVPTYSTLSLKTVVHNLLFTFHNGLYLDIYIPHQLKRWIHPLWLSTTPWKHGGGEHCTHPSHFIPKKRTPVPTGLQSLSGSCS